ncbi:MAG: fluoride efflux transporter CrcB [Pseudomonadota bacterium]
MSENLLRSGDAAYKPAMNGFLLVAAGGAIGASMRHGAGLAALRIAPGTAWPVATFSVNLLGSLAMGLLIGWLVHRTSGGQGLRLFFATGVLGGFTTFSAFSMEIAGMIERGDVLKAAAYAVASVILGLGAFLIGLFAMRGLIQ